MQGVARAATAWTNRTKTALSSRIDLQPVTSADAEELFAIFRDAAVRRYLLDDREVSEEWVRAEIAASAERFASIGVGLWAIRLRATARIIGFVGFREFFDPPQLQLLYALLPQFWKQGLATEAATVACAYAFDELGFAAICAATDVPNEDSAQVLQRLGMSLVRLSGDGHAGTAHYAITRAAWYRRT